VWATGEDGALRFTDPAWHGVDPVVFDWASVDPPTFWATVRRRVEPDELEPSTFAFAPGECHEKRTGRCSLTMTERVDDEPGEGGFDNCRELADVASLWDFIRQAVPGPLPTDTAERSELAEDPALQDRILTEWTPPYGTAFPYLHIAIENALSAYGQGTDEILGDVGPGGKITLSDGCHRTCVAFRRGIPVEATVGEERSRLHS
jgi:hypothetical protein